MTRTNDARDSITALWISSSDRDKGACKLQFLFKSVSLSVKALTFMSGEDA